VLVTHPTPFVSVANCAANLQTPPALFFCVLPVVCVLHLSRSRKGLDRIFLLVDKRLKQHAGQLDQRWKCVPGISIAHSAFETYL
jgi:hypothetical protein